MSDDSLSSIFTILGLILARGVLAMAYGALSNVRQTALRERAEDGDKAAKRILTLALNNTQLLITYQTATILLNFAIAAVTVLQLTVPLLSNNPNLSPLLVNAVALILAASLTMILGELMPEAIGSAYSNTLATWVASPMHWLIILLRPITASLVSVSRVLSGIFSSGSLVNTVTEAEIMTLVESGEAGGAIEAEEREMIFSVLQLGETYASEVMVPRIDIKALDIDTPLDDARQTFIKTGYSRIPVYEDSIDNIKGLLYAKDLLNYWQLDHQGTINSIRDLLRPAYFVPETKRADDLLKDLQTQRVHLAIVVDEFGGTAGIVTIENIIEEIIGDIRDEYDPEEEAEYIKLDENIYQIDAGMDLDDFNDLLDVELPTDESDTLGGFIYTRLGHVPVAGEELQYEAAHMTLKIEEVEGRRIRKVRVTVTPPKKETGETPSVAEDNTDLTAQVAAPEPS